MAKDSNKRSAPRGAAAVSKSIAWRSFAAAPTTQRRGGGGGARPGRTRARGSGHATTTTTTTITTTMAAAAGDAGVPTEHPVFSVSFDAMQPLGVTMQPVHAGGEDDGYTGPPQQDPRRFWVQFVSGQAEKLGVVPGDLLFGVEGAVQHANPFGAIQQVTSRKAPGVAVHVALVRGFIGGKKGVPRAGAGLHVRSFTVEESLGLTLRPVQDAGGRTASVVVALVAGAQGERLGVQPGDVIVGVGGQVQDGDAMPHIKETIKVAKAGGAASFDVVFFRPATSSSHGDDGPSGGADDAADSLDTGRRPAQQQPPPKTQPHKVNVGDMFKKSVFGNMFKKKEAAPSPGPTGSTSSAGPGGSSPSSSSSSSTAAASAPSPAPTKVDAGAKMNKMFGDLFGKKKKAPAAGTAMGSDDAEATIASLRGQLDATKIALEDAERQLGAERKRHAQTVQQLVNLRQAARAQEQLQDNDSDGAAAAAEEQDEAAAAGSPSSASTGDAAAPGELDASAALAAALGEQGRRFKQAQEERDAAWVECVRALLEAAAAEARESTQAALAALAAEVQTCAATLDDDEGVGAGAGAGAQ